MSSPTQSPNTILVSPHPDDVALSIGGSVLSGVLKPPLLLVTVFSVGGWSPFYHGNYQVDRISSLRADEDASFAEAIGAGRVDLGLTDRGWKVNLDGDFDRVRWASSIVGGGVVRSDGSQPQGAAGGFERGAARLAKRAPYLLRWTAMRSIARQDEAYPGLVSRLSALVSLFPQAKVTIPLSLGLHPDHVITTCACSKATPSSRAIFYEDLPYAGRYMDYEIRRHVANFERGLTPLLVNVDGFMDEKMRTLRLYSSQLGPADYDSVSGHAMALGRHKVPCERMWVAGGSVLPT